MSLGERLRRLRIEKGFTLDDIARMLKTTSATISRYERDKIEPNIETLKKLSKIFNISIDYLVGNDYDNFFDLVLIAKQIEELTEEQKEIIEVLINYFRDINKSKKKGIKRVDKDFSESGEQN